MEHFIFAQILFQNEVSSNSMLDIMHMFPYNEYHLFSMTMISNKLRL
jgi:hypothetical protein